jgi:hypothetical protein
MAVLVWVVANTSRVLPVAIVGAEIVIEKDDFKIFSA